MLERLKKFFKSEFDWRKKATEKGTLPNNYNVKRETSITATITDSQFSEDIVLQFWGWAIWLKEDGTWSCEDTSGQ